MTAVEKALDTIDELDPDLAAGVQPASTQLGLAISTEGRCGEKAHSWRFLSREEGSRGGALYECTGCPVVLRVRRRKGAQHQAYSYDGKHFDPKRPICAALEQGSSS